MAGGPGEQALQELATVRSQLSASETRVDRLVARMDHLEAHAPVAVLRTPIKVPNFPRVLRNIGLHPPGG